MKRATLSLLAILAALVFNGEARACTFAPAHLYLDHVQIIDDAEWIVLAAPVQFERIRELPWGGEAQRVRLQVMSTLKGNAPAEITIESWSTHFNETGPISDVLPDDRNRHRDVDFWRFGGGSAHQGVNCRVYPSIIPGEHQYLIFGPLDYNLGYEPIVTTDDLWLDFVASELEDDGFTPYQLTWGRVLDWLEARGLN